MRYPGSWCGADKRHGPRASRCECSLTTPVRRRSGLRTLGLLVLTALAEIGGCYLPQLWLNQGKTAWLLVPAVCCLALFVWLLSLHPAATGRVYAAYGGVYVAVAVGWLWQVDGIKPTAWDLTGAAVALAGMAIMVFAPRQI